MAATPFCFITGSGHQYFLDTVRQLIGMVSAERVRAALFAPWTYSDEKLSMRWDPVEDRRYALMDRDLHPQFKVRHQAAREAADVIDDDRVLFLPLRLEEGQHRLHAGPRRKAAGRIVTEDLDNLIALVFRKLAAPGLDAASASALDPIKERIAPLNPTLRASRFCLSLLPRTMHKTAARLTGNQEGVPAPSPQ